MKPSLRMGRIANFSSSMPPLTGGLRRPIGFHVQRRHLWCRLERSTYVVLANFTDQGIRKAKESPKRAEAFRQLAKTLGVTVRDIFWTQGRYDIVTIVEASDESSATSLNLSLGALGNVRTESLRAFSAADMTTIVGKMI
jgi:uncharacterized protein with GYD domain